MFTRESSHQISGRYCPRALKSNASLSKPCAMDRQSFALNGSGLLGMSSTRPIDNCSVGPAIAEGSLTTGKLSANSMSRAILIVACHPLYRHHRREDLGLVQSRGHDIGVAAAIDDVDLTRALERAAGKQHVTDAVGI